MNKSKTDILFSVHIYDAINKIKIPAVYKRYQSKRYIPYSVYMVLYQFAQVTLHQIKDEPSSQLMKRRADMVAQLIIET